MRKIAMLVFVCIPFVSLGQSIPTLVSDITTGSGSGNPKSIVALGNEIIFQGTSSGTFALDLFRYKPSTGLTKITGTGAYSAIYNTRGPVWSYGLINNKVIFPTEYAPIWPSTSPSTGSTYSIAEGGVPQVIDTLVANIDVSRSLDFQTALLGTKLYCWGHASAGFGLCYINSSHHMELAGAFDPWEFEGALEITACNNKIFFISQTSSGHRLNMFDPASITFTEIPIPVSAGDPAPLDLHAGDNNTLYFSANTNSEGRELYAYSPSGTLTKLTALNTSADGVYTEGLYSRAYNIIKFGNAVYFAGCNGLNGFDLMKYDISTSATSLVKDINPSTGSSKPNNFYVFGGKLYFAADNGSNGMELWVTDGTTANTTLVADINPGSSGSYPTSFCAMGGKMYFAADNGTAGTELYSYSGSSTSSVSAIDNGNKVKAYPNPSLGSVTVDIEFNTPSIISIILSDINGKQLYRSEQQQYSVGVANITIPIQNYPSGHYYYSILNEQQNIISSGKIEHK